MGHMLKLHVICCGQRHISRVSPPNLHFALVRPLATCQATMPCASDVNVELIAIATREHIGAKHKNEMIQHLSWSMSGDWSNLNQHPLQINEILWRI